MSPRDLLLLFVLGCMWGASFMYISVALQELTPLLVVTGRVVLGSVGLVGFAAIARLREASPAALAHRWGDYLVLALFSAVFPYGLITLGQTVIPSGSAAILNATSPLFSAGLALLVARGHEEALTARRAGGLVLGLLGVAALVAKPAEAPRVEATFLELTLGHGAVVAGSACYAVAALYIRRHMMGVSPTAISLGQTVVAALLLVPVALAFGGPLSVPSAAPLAAVAALGLLNTAVAYLIYYGLVKRAGATRALSVTYLQPASALVYGALLLHEPVTWSQLLGLGAILGGVALATRG